MKSLIWQCIKCNKAYEIKECSNCTREANGNLMYVDLHEIGGTSLVCKVCGYVTHNFTCSCGAVNKFSIERQSQVPLPELTIHRASRIGGMAVAIDIYVDDSLVATLGNGEVKKIKVFPGKTTLKAKAFLNPTGEITLDLIAGHEYYLKTYISMFGIVVETK